MDCLCALGPAMRTYCPEHGIARAERLAGYGYRLADQDGGDGEELVSPQRDFEETLIEAVKVLLDAREI